MNRIKNQKLTPFAQKLRKEMTKEERKLWYEFLKPLPITVHRQKVFDKYIVDFYIASEKIAIELDGSQHYEEEHAIKDIERNKYFSQLGITVLRYSNLDVLKNFEGVCVDISRHLKKHL